MARRNKIVMTGTCELKDEELREAYSKLFTKVETLNERTKRHTLEIKELRRRIKE